MNPEIVTRLVLASGVIILGAGIFFLANQAILARARGNNSQPFFADGKPVLLYFTTPTCAPCKTIQRPAIRRVQEMLGERVKIIEIDATKDPKMASTWGVLSVPTTFIIDRKGQPRHVNHGVATVEKLQRQLNDFL